MSLTLSFLSFVSCEPKTFKQIVPPYEEYDSSDMQNDEETRAAITSILEEMPMKRYMKRALETKSTGRDPRHFMAGQSDAEHSGAAHPSAIHVDDEQSDTTDRSFTPLPRI